MGPARTKVVIAIIVTMVLVPVSASQQTASVLRGNWTATAAAETWQGRWTAEVVHQDPNTARGSWTVLGSAGHTLLEGTWSARKQSAGWKGTWAARTLQSHALSGTWQASAGGYGKTLEEMLRSAIEREIEGMWQSGRQQGKWQLKRPD